MNATHLSYSVEGEDRILARMFEGKRNGFYVDIGACDPLYFSQTRLLYEAFNWRGVNVDATPGSMNSFNQSRPDDTNIEMGVGSGAQNALYYMFEQPALNSFNITVSEGRIESGSRLLNKIEVMVRPLSCVMHAHVPYGTEIDLLNIDVEGSELNVLKSNDWSYHRPKVVAVECSAYGSRPGYTVREVQQTALCRFLEGRGYEFFAKTYETAIFRRGD
jgi:FkbM family methyltransferase